MINYDLKKTYLFLINFLTNMANAELEIKALINDTVSKQENVKV
jgi:hypothetical protein